MADPANPKSQPAPLQLAVRAPGGAAGRSGDAVGGLVKDINPSPGGEPQELTAIGSTLYFNVLDDTHGRELWKTDGTAGGTSLVKDIDPGVRSSGPQDLTRFKEPCSSPPRIKTMARSCGRATAPRRAPSWSRTSSRQRPAPTPPLHERRTARLFFAANDGTQGTELWKSDGTAAGTVLVKDINPGSAGFTPRYLTNVNGTLFFSANDGTHGVELWKSDGTAAGTVLVKDIRPGSDGSYPGNLTNVNGTLFFSGQRRHARLRAVEERRHRRRHRPGQGHQPRQHGSYPAGPDDRRTARCSSRPTTATHGVGAVEERRHRRRHRAGQGHRPGQRTAPIRVS